MKTSGSDVLSVVTHVIRRIFVDVSLSVCLPACLPACLLACLPACLPLYHFNALQLEQLATTTTAATAGIRRSRARATLLPSNLIPLTTGTRTASAASG